MITRAAPVKSFRAVAFNEATEADILDRIRLDRMEEYFELKEQCSISWRKSKKRSAGKISAFAEYEENEQDLVKLEAWLEKVRQRDISGR